MKVSLNWLREHVDLAGLDGLRIAELLTRAGVEVERIDARGVAIDDVVVARIAASAQHPNADRLSVCQVEHGTGELRQIVCGAKNYRVGDHVPLALPGAVLSGNLRIKPSRLRGVESQGMLCSARELGISDDAEGLLILPRETQPGAAISEYFPADTVLDVEVTPNRPDLLSHRGMAREIGALTGTGFNPGLPAVDPGVSDPFVRVAAPDLCPFYSARRITNVRVAPSPAWLQRKLGAAGLRPINNVVDITNYVMLDLGQPLHAFDAARVGGGILVREARADEHFLALDGRSYSLRREHLVIADHERAMALAGVMGGAETAVTDATHEVILESALFAPSNIRRTARLLGLASDSSYRFERGVDPCAVLAALQRAVDLLVELAGGIVELPPMVAGALPSESARVPLRPHRCRAILGADIADGQMRSILTRLGLTEGAGGWSVPSYRQDLTREIDLIEEVIRVHGIEKIAGRAVAPAVASSASDRVHDRHMRLRTALMHRGFHEGRTGSLISESSAAAYTFETCEIRRVRNPLSEDQVVLRPSLLPGLLRVLGDNVHGGIRRVRMFEIGRVFRGEGDEERTHLALVMTGPLSVNSWRKGDARSFDFFDAKGVLAGLQLGLIEAAKTEMASLALAIRLQLAGEDAGFAGQLPPVPTRALDVTTPVFVAEIRLPDVDVQRERKVFTPINRYPAVTRDIAILVSVGTTDAEIVAAIRSGNEPLLEDLTLFDVFTDPTGGGVPADQKSMAYSLTYRAADRTLKLDEANVAHARLKDRLKAELGVVFRE